MDNAAAIEMDVTDLHLHTGKVFGPFNQMQVKMTVIQMYVFAPPLVVQRQLVKTVQRMVQINVLAVLLGKNLPPVALAILVQAVHIRTRLMPRAASLVAAACSALAASAAARLRACVACVHRETL